MNPIPNSTIKLLIFSSVAILSFVWIFDIRIETNKVSLMEKYLGNPFFIDNMEVAEFDCHGSFSEIKETVSEIGHGWRIPSIEEYKTMCQHRDIVSNLTNTAYWTCDNNPRLKRKKYQYFIPSGRIQNVSTNKWMRFWDVSGAYRQPVRFVRTH